MTNEMSLSRMNDCELDNVVGGTVNELEGLAKACCSNETLKKLVGVGVHLPKTAIATAYLMESTLDKMGISANISVGVGGTGAFSKHNTYYDRNLNRNLSQGEVEDRLRYHAA